MAKTIPSEKGRLKKSFQTAFFMPVPFRFPIPPLPGTRSGGRRGYGKPAPPRSVCPVRRKRFYRLPKRRQSIIVSIIPSRRLRPAALPC
ncbi:hypothetical protein [Neisseria musculi]|uniref:hypothetical protein n=1 Tax=Neisseria musculi TaxID=1815583 RepID=UPI00164B324D|nr:hypothetical protein [Neisseria musculi]